MPGEGRCPSACNREPPSEHSLESTCKRPRAMHSLTLDRYHPSRGFAVLPSFKRPPQICDRLYWMLGGRICTGQLTRKNTTCLGGSSQLSVILVCCCLLSTLPLLGLLPILRLSGSRLPLLRAFPPAGCPCNRNNSSHRARCFQHCFVLMPLQTSMIRY